MSEHNGTGPKPTTLTPEQRKAALLHFLVLIDAGAREAMRLLCCGDEMLHHSRTQASQLVLAGDTTPSDAQQLAEMAAQMHRNAMAEVQSLINRAQHLAQVVQAKTASVKPPAGSEGPRLAD